LGQFIARWDPGAKSKKGEDCFSIASQYTPSRLRARDGSIKIVAGGDAEIYASLLSAADDILIEAESIVASARGESYLGKVKIDNSRRNRTIKKEADIILQRVRIESGGNARFIARKNVKVTGGTILAALEVEFNGENISLRPIQIIAENKVKQYGSRGFTYYKDSEAYSTSEVASTDVIANRIKLDAKNDVNIKASMLMAMEDINITAGNDINVVEELVTHYVHSSQFEGHLKFFGQETMQRVLERDFKAARRSFECEFSNLSQMKRLLHARKGADIAAEGIKSFMSLYDEYKAFKAAGSLGNYLKKEAAEKLMSASAEISHTKTKKEWTEAILPVMKAKEILMKAGRNINLRGLQAKADKMSLQAQNAINIQAAQEYYRQHQNRRNLGIHGHVNYDPTKQKFSDKFAAPTIGVSAGYASSEQSGVKNINSHIDVQTFEAITPGTITIEGANINATDVKLVAHALRMRSLVDTEKGKHKAISGGLDYNMASGGLSGHIEGSRGHHSYAQVGEQTGIKALGTFIAEIGDMTHLQGAFIDAVNGTLKTARFQYEDVEEHKKSKDINFGIGSFEFMRNSLFVKPDTITPDIGFSSQNRKERLKSGVSSGVQIITQSDISGLNHDLSKARELVKNHKHYVRVVVPIPTSREAAKRMWNDLKALVTPSTQETQNNAESNSEYNVEDNAEDSEWENPDNQWKNPDYEEVYKALDENKNLDAEQKIEALKDYTDLERQKTAIEAMIQQEAYDVIPMDKPDLEIQNEIAQEDSEAEDSPQENEKSILRIQKTSDEYIITCATKGAESEEVKLKYFKSIDNIVNDAETKEAPKRKLSYLHDILSAARILQEAEASFEGNYLSHIENMANALPHNRMGGIVDRIGQLAMNKVAQLAVYGLVSQATDMSKKELVDVLHNPDNGYYKHIRNTLGIKNEDMSTLGDILVAGIAQKATNRILKSKRTKTSKQYTLPNANAGPRVSKANSSSSSQTQAGVKVKKPVREMSDQEFAQSIANRVDKKFEGKGAVVGTKKHEHAKKLGKRYQEMYKDKTDLKFEQRYKGGKKYERDSGDTPKGSVVPDVYNEKTGKAYDYKFGDAKLRERQQRKLKSQMPKDDYEDCTMIKPNHKDVSQ
jgi:hypothetical protein